MGGGASTATASAMAAVGLPPSWYAWLKAETAQLKDAEAARPSLVRVVDLGPDLASPGSGPRGSARFRAVLQVELERRGAGAESQGQARHVLAVSALAGHCGEGGSGTKTWTSTVAFEASAHLTVFGLRPDTLYEFDVRAEGTADSVQVHIVTPPPPPRRSLSVSHSNSSLWSSEDSKRESSTGPGVRVASAGALSEVETEGRSEVASASCPAKREGEEEEAPEAVRSAGEKPETERCPAEEERAQASSGRRGASESREEAAPAAREEEEEEEPPAQPPSAASRATPAAEEGSRELPGGTAAVPTAEVAARELPGGAAVAPPPGREADGSSGEAQEEEEEEEAFFDAEEELTETWDDAYEAVETTTGSPTQCEENGVCDEVKH